MQCMPRDRLYFFNYGHSDALLCQMYLKQKGISHTSHPQIFS